MPLLFRRKVVVVVVVAKRESQEERERKCGKSAPSLGWGDPFLLSPRVLGGDHNKFGDKAQKMLTPSTRREDKSRERERDNPRHLPL